MTTHTRTAPFPLPCRRSAGPPLGTDSAVLGPCARWACLTSAAGPWSALAPGPRWGGVGYRGGARSRPPRPPGGLRPLPPAPPARARRTRVGARSGAPHSASSVPSARFSALASWQFACRYASSYRITPPLPLPHRLPPRGLPGPGAPCGKPDRRAHCSSRATRGVLHVRCCPPASGIRGLVRAGPPLRSLGRGQAVNAAPLRSG
jgi:hypothetical protein